MVICEASGRLWKCQTQGKQTDARVRASIICSDHLRRHRSDFDSLNSEQKKTDNQIYASIDDKKEKRRNANHCRLQAPRVAPAAAHPSRRLLDEEAKGGPRWPSAQTLLVLTASSQVIASRSRCKCLRRASFASSSQGLARRRSSAASCAARHT